MFAKGDMVRVKAGSPPYCSPGSRMGPYETDYGKGFVVNGVRRLNDFDCCMLSGTNSINAEYLEPWNDNEEWDGNNWVAKAHAVPHDGSKVNYEKGVECDMSLVGKVSTDPFVPDEVIISGVRYVRKPVEKTNAEKLEQYFMEGFDRPTEFANGRSMICKANVVNVSRTGNRVTVVYDAGE